MMLTHATQVLMWWRTTLHSWTASGLVWAPSCSKVMWSVFNVFLTSIKKKLQLTAAWGGCFREALPIKSMWSSDFKCRHRKDAAMLHANMRRKCVTQPSHALAGRGDISRICFCEMWLLSGILLSCCWHRVGVRIKPHKWLWFCLGITFTHTAEKTYHLLLSRCPPTNLPLWFCFLALSEQPFSLPEVLLWSYLISIFGGKGGGGKFSRKHHKHVTHYLSSHHHPTFTAPANILAWMPFNFLPSGFSCSLTKLVEEKSY